MLERLISARLVIAAGSAVRIAHEALIAHWPRLQQLVRQYSALGSKPNQTIDARKEA